MKNRSSISISSGRELSVGERQQEGIENVSGSWVVEIIDEAIPASLAL